MPTQVWQNKYRNATKYIETKNDGEQSQQSDKIFTKSLDKILKSLCRSRCSARVLASHDPAVVGGLALKVILREADSRTWSASLSITCLIFGHDERSSDRSFAGAGLALHRCEVSKPR